jgi:type II secretory pathway component PulK
MSGANASPIGRSHQGMSGADARPTRSARAIARSLKKRRSQRVMTADRGMILITVMWIILILSIISFSLAASVRVELASSQQSFDSERAFFLAKGAAEVVYNAYDRKQQIPENPVRQERGEYIFPFETGEARVRFESNGGFIDLNSATDVVLASMFASLGISEATGSRLVDSILDWRDADDIPHLYGAEVNDYPENIQSRTPRPYNRAFGSVDELLLVRNMTPEFFYGSLSLNSATGFYKRVPGIRELVTVNSGSGKVDVNEAAPEVLAAVPFITQEMVERITSERDQTRFANQDDLVKRVPELVTRGAIDFLTAESAAMPAMIVSRATIAGSGVSRTVRLVFKRQEKTQILLFVPLLYKKTMEAKFDRWRFD